MTLEIRYKCPKCGSKVDYVIGASYPPTHIYTCTNPNCDYVKYIHEELEIIEKEAPK